MLKQIRRMAGLRRAALAAGILLAVVPAVAFAITKTQSQTTTHGGVVATVTYQPGKFEEDKNTTLKITGTGPAYDAAVKSKFCSTFCEVPPRALAIKNLSNPSYEKDPPADRYDVILELYTGGAHCCFIDQVFRVSGATYVKSEHDFGDPGARLEAIGSGGTTVFVTADDAFAYEFASFAESGLPIEILAVNGAKFIDVTADHPALIRKDAAVWWKGYRSDHDSGRAGLIAAWAADEYNLGRVKSADATLSTQVKDHRISAKFVTELKKFLKKHGYPKKAKNAF